MSETTIAAAGKDLNSHTVWNSGQASDQILLRIARQCKGVHPAVDAKIDARASLISGRQEMRSIPGRIPGEAVVPLVLCIQEDHPAEEASWAAMTAVLNFCSVTGLNFVHNPHPETGVRPVDFAYFDISVTDRGIPDAEQAINSVLTESIRTQLQASPFALVHLQMDRDASPQLGDALVELVCEGRFNSLTTGNALFIFSQPEGSDAIDATRCFSVVLG